jgi:hypothetical protein
MAAEGTGRWRLLIVLGVLAAVAAVVIGYKLRVVAAGGKAIVVIAVIGLLVWLAWRSNART